MAGNKSLHAASRAKEDEFYTELSDIEEELKYYKQHFKDKIIFCNCDDPYESNFFKYFAMNFNQLGLKKLIATCYDGSPVANTQLALFDYNSEIKVGELKKKISVIERDENDYYLNKPYIYYQNAPHIVSKKLYDEYKDTKMPSDTFAFDVIKYIYIKKVRGG